MKGWGLRAAATRAKRLSTPARRALGCRNSGVEGEQGVRFLLRGYASGVLVNDRNGNYQSQGGEKAVVSKTKSECGPR